MDMLKAKLIDKINKTSDRKLLEKLCCLLDRGFDDIYKLSNEQKTAIKEAKKQIKEGNFLTDEESNKITGQWINNK